MPYIRPGYRIPHYPEIKNNTEKIENTEINNENEIETDVDYDVEITGNEKVIVNNNYGPDGKMVDKSD